MGAHVQESHGQQAMDEDLRVPPTTFLFDLQGPVEMQALGVVTCLTRVDLSSAAQRLAQPELCLQQVAFADKWLNKLDPHMALEILHGRPCWKIGNFLPSICLRPKAEG